MAEQTRTGEIGPIGGSIEDAYRLEDLLSEPPDYVVKSLGELDGDITVLGVGGKMGPTLARMAKRASDVAGRTRRVIGVSRFSSTELPSRLQSWGIETVSRDLLDPEQVDSLPDAANVVFMAGMKFGTSGQERLTWAMNTCLPGVICRRFRDSRIVAFSTGNVYGMVPVHLGGSLETDSPNPNGEYAMSALGRERVFEYYSSLYGVPVSIVRLNYAVEMRYGVLVDIAQKVFAGEPVDLTMGSVNVIWQGDANAVALGALSHAASPPCVLNITGPETVSVRRTAERFATLMGKDVAFSGSESTDAFLSNAQLACALFGYPRVGLGQMVHWIADWVMRGGENHGTATHFEARDGAY